ncbi:hypothetical protein QYE76_051801 [Lolium multiflorum]|uniref:4-hydroxy-7-methoxy-3-oxo-3,4-dihydro-2H-1,4-benzoxazin-2-yl glucosidebeta-D-glucosidase n=1 Tax=Lolium multiflorum TaxID=4521 RepID=A0AAD8SSI2_LOLMU|nr:hypothetical protein QYE76_051801 [Lolium multiflorum]
MAPLLFFLLAGLAALPRDAAALTRGDFPDGFIFGAGTSAYQVEGAAAEDGRKPSIWDTFTHQGHSTDKSTGDVAADQYHHYKLMHQMGLDAYRFSIAWPRLIPDGRGAINPKGLEYYNNLIDELILHGIQPHVTLYHFDLPQSLQDEYDGLLSPRFIDDYTKYADVCFENFGDRVKHWVTVNEPNIETLGGFDSGTLPPRRCSVPFGANCSRGDSTMEPYVAAHHLLLAHASAVSLYRHKYQDAVAATRMNDFHIGWFMHPLVYGDYPPVMRTRVSARLLDITAEQSRKLSGSFDFIGLNHYAVFRASADENAFNLKQRDYFADGGIADPIKYILEGQNEYAPWALGKLLDHLKLKNGSDVQGYFVWSFVDVFEFLFGNRMRYGLYGVDMNSKERTRYMRNSARWYSSFLKGGELRSMSPSGKAYSAA